MTEPTEDDKDPASPEQPAADAADAADAAEGQGAPHDPAASDAPDAAQAKKRPSRRSKAGSRGKGRQEQSAHPVDRDQVDDTAEPEPAPVNERGTEPTPTAPRDTEPTPTAPGGAGSTHDTEPNTGHRVTRRKVSRHTTHEDIDETIEETFDVPAYQAPASPHPRPVG